MQGKSQEQHRGETFSWNSYYLLSFKQLDSRVIVGFELPNFMFGSCKTKKKEKITLNLSI
jgi:hypothetical protein